MPQIDLGPLFPSSDRPQRPTGSSADAERDQLNQLSGFFSRLRISGPQLANVAFVTAACVGAIFSAAYLFKGDELLHEVAAWPRELFSGRPATIAEVTAEKENAESPGATATLADQSAAPNNASGDPFSTTRKLLGLDSAAPPMARPNNESSLPFSLSPLPQPEPAANGPATGTDPLSSNLISGVPASPQSGSIATNNVDAASGSVAGTAAQAGRSSATSNSAATRAANRASNVVRAPGRQPAARPSNIRPPRPSAFRNAMMAITRSLRAPKAAPAKSTPARRLQTRNNALARANHGRLVNPKNTAAHRSKVANKTVPGPQLFGTKRSVKASNSRQAPRSSRIIARSTIGSRSPSTMGTEFTRGSASSMRGAAPAGISGSAGALRSFGSMGGHGFGGGGGGGGGRGR